ncbi:MAG: hypothetical protein HY276_00930 [Ignavibacteriales bacterium]|nr:hypothetical protein [Ignavibacteriales bacterium]
MFASTVFSQVIIREKVEVKPKAPKAEKQHTYLPTSKAALEPIRFFKPDSSFYPILGVPTRQMRVSVSASLGPVIFDNLHVDAYAELWLDEHLLARTDRSGTTLTPVELDAGACVRMIPHWKFFDGASESLTTAISNAHIEYTLTGVMNYAGHNGTVPVSGAIQINAVSDPRFDLQKIYVSADTLWRCGGTSDVSITLLTGVGLPYAFCDSTTFPVKVSVSAPIDINLIVKGVRSKSFTIRSDSIGFFQAIQVEWDLGRAPMNQDGRLTATITAEALSIRDSATIALECSTPPIVFTGGVIRLHSNPLETPYTEWAGFYAEVTDTNGTVIQFPDTITFTYEVIGGQQWGYLYDFATDRSGLVLEGLPTNVAFFPNDSSWYDERRVVVKCTASDPRIKPGTAELKILPGRLKVIVTPATLNYGDIAQIAAEGIILNGVVNPLDPTATVSYEILLGNDAGYLTANGSTGHVDVINDVGPTASFVALEETPQPISTQAIIKVTASTTVIEGKALENQSPAHEFAPLAKGKKRDKVQVPRRSGIPGRRFPRSRTNSCRCSTRCL